MRDENNQNKYGYGWNYQEGNKQSYHDHRSGNKSQRPISYCPYCGEKLNRSNETRNSERLYQSNDKRLYASTSQNNFSCSSILVSLVIVILLIIMLASCNSASASSSFTPELENENSNAEYNNEVTSSVDNIVTASANYQVISTKNDIENHSQTNYSDYKRYIVMPGDTVYRIAVTMLGDGSRWVEIAQLNNLVSLSNGSVLIHPGQELILP